MSHRSTRRRPPPTVIRSTRRRGGAPVKSTSRRRPKKTLKRAFGDISGKLRRLYATQERPQRYYYNTYKSGERTRNYLSAAEAARASARAEARAEAASANEETELALLARLEAPAHHVGLVHEARAAAAAASANEEAVRSPSALRSACQRLGLPPPKRGTLDLPNCDLGTNAGDEILAKALKGNGALTALNLSGNRLKHGFVQSLADAIPTMGALAKFNISNNHLRSPGAKALATALQGNSVLTDLNLSSNNLAWHEKDGAGNDISGIIAISNAIPTMGALVKLDMSANRICAEGGQLLVAALEDNPNTTELITH